MPLPRNDAGKTKVRKARHVGAATPDVGAISGSFGLRDRMPWEARQPRRREEERRGDP